MTREGATRDPAETLRVTVWKFYGDRADVLGDGQAAALAADVDAYLEVLRASKKEHEGIDLGLAEKLAAACHGLLDGYPGLDENGKRAVVGAVRYFIEPFDAEDDLKSDDGLVDDVELVNFVIALTRSKIPLIALD